MVNQHQKDAHEKERLAAKNEILKAKLKEVETLRARVGELENSTGVRDDIVKEWEILRGKPKDFDSVRLGVVELERASSKKDRNSVMESRSKPGSVEESTVAMEVDPATTATKTHLNGNRNQLSYAQKALISAPNTSMLPESLREKALEAKKRIEQPWPNEIRTK